MIIIPHGFDLHWAWLLPVLYLIAPRTWVPGEMVTSNMMNTLRNLFIEIEDGTANMKKVTLAGQTTAALAAMLSTPGKAAMAYDSQQNAIVQSVNGGAYEGVWRDVPYLATNFAASSGTWTVPAGSVQKFRYCIVGKIMYVNIYLTSTTLSANAQNLWITIPGGQQTATSWAGSARVAQMYDSAGMREVFIGANGYTIYLQINTGALFAAGEAPIVLGSLAFEIL